MAGLFGRFKARDQAPASPTANDAPGDGSIDVVVDTLAAVLRLYGREARDTEQLSGERVRRVCEEWARHALLGTPPPSPGGAQATDGDSVPISQREWSGLRRAFRDLRKGEIDHEGRLGTALRGTVLELIEVVHKALHDGKGLDDDLAKRSQQLREALDGGDPEGLRKAAHEVVSSLEHSLEVRQVIHESAVRTLGSRLRLVRDQLKEATRAAELDSLTGLANRAALDRRIAASVTLGRFGGQHECMLMLDIDHFKDLNDKHGHRLGDKVLAEIGACLAKAIIRRSDFVARYGGEEFTVILSDTEEDRATIVAERLLDDIRALSVATDDGRVLRVTASIGVAELRRDDDGATWLEAADKAMYAAKAEGRDQLSVRE